MTKLRTLQLATLASSAPAPNADGTPVTTPGSPQRAKRGGGASFTVHQRREPSRPQSFASRRRGK